jgi:hypothetical protein
MLAAAFVISELKTGFTIGFLITFPSWFGYGYLKHTSCNGYDDAAANDGINAL